MRPLLLLAATISGADERAPAPRPAPNSAVAALAAFFDDLKRDDIKAAHARVGSWAKPVFADREGFAQQWRRMLRWHGPLGAVTVERDGAVVVADVRFARQGYYFAAEAKSDGTLGGFQMMPYETGSANLLWAGHGVRVTAADPKRPADGVVTFAVPGPYREQVPLSLTLAADPPGALKGHKLRRRDDGLNWVLEVTVNPGAGGATVFWEAAVLTRADRRPGVVGPATSVVEPEAPPEAARWLRPTGCVQSGDPAVVKRAGWLRAGGATLCDYRSAVAKWVSENRGTGKPFRTLDAAAAVGCGGSCTSKANLAAALFRARGVPARTVAHLPMWSGPLYVHWLTEYWHPGVGWEAVEPSQGTAYAGLGGVVVLNVATPEDEDEAVWPNRRSGVMDGAPRLSSRELDGPIRTVGVMTSDLRCWGQCVPLAALSGDQRYAWAGLAVSDRFGWLLRSHPGLYLRALNLARLVESLPGWLEDARLDALWAAARTAHAGLTVNDPKRAALTAAAQTGGVDGLMAALKTLAGE